MGLRSGKLEEVITVSSFSMILINATLKRLKQEFGTEAIDMLEFTAKSDVKQQVGKITIGEDGISEALSRCVTGDANYRFVVTSFKKAYKQNYIERLDFANNENSVKFLIAYFKL